MRVTKQKLIVPNQEPIIRQKVSHTRASLHTYQHLAVPSGRVSYYTTARAEYIAPALQFVWATEGGKKMNHLNHSATGQLSLSTSTSTRWSLVSKHIVQHLPCKLQRLHGFRGQLCPRTDHPNKGDKTGTRELETCSQCRYGIRSLDTRCQLYWLV
jgi:hypothetical protein